MRGVRNKAAALSFIQFQLLCKSIKLVRELTELVVAGDHMTISIISAGDSIHAAGEGTEPTQGQPGKQKCQQYSEAADCHGKNSNALLDGQNNPGAFRIVLEQ